MGLCGRSAQGYLGADTGGLKGAERGLGRQDQYFETNWRQPAPASGRACWEQHMGDLWRPMPEAELEASRLLETGTPELEGHWDQR
jgi:hypothetical protein